MIKKIGEAILLLLSFLYIYMCLGFCISDYLNSGKISFVSR